MKKKQEKIATAPLFIKLLKYKNKSKNKRNILKNFILINGGIEGIKKECGTISLFLKYCGPNYHDIFSREYLARAKKELLQLEKELKII